MCMCQAQRQGLMMSYMLTASQLLNCEYLQVYYYYYSNLHQRPSIKINVNKTAGTYAVCTRVDRSGWQSWKEAAKKLRVYFIIDSLPLMCTPHEY